MGIHSLPDESIDPKQQQQQQQKTGGTIYVYRHEHYNYPQPAPGYPISTYHQPHDPHYPSIPSYHTHENYPIKPGQQYAYPAHYYTHHQPGPLLPEPASSSSNFNRMMLILMVFLIGCMCMMSLFMWLLYASYIPEFEVSSLHVSNFTASGRALTGTWSVGLVVRNTNQDLTVGFDNIRAAVLYRGNILGYTSVRSFGFGRDEKFDLAFDVPAVADAVDAQDDWVMPSLARDWRDGAVLFGLRMAMSANFSSADRSGYMQQSLTVSCDNLEVSSSPAGGDGRLSGGVGSQCLISF